MNNLILGSTEAYSKNSCASGHPTLPKKLPPTLTFFSDATKKNRGCPFAIRSLRNGLTNYWNTTEIPPFLGFLIQISDKCTIHLSFFVLLTQYVFILTFIVSLKHHDRKINMPTTFVEKKYMHRKTRMCSRKYLLHLVKFADSGYYAFFSTKCV